MQVSQKGLSHTEAEKKLKEYGPNTLPEKPPPSGISIFISQLKNPLVYVLVFAGAITFILRHFSDTAIILLAVFINTILGFVQERKASKALYELKKLIQPKAKVVRDGKVETIDATHVVPGDVVILNQGDKVPADGELIEANRMFLDESLLTGESSPASKEVGSKVFMATTVTSGRGEFLVTQTGDKTEVGKIAIDIQEKSEDTPLKKQLVNFSRQLVVMILSLTFLVFVIGLLRGRELYEMFTASIALAVSAIPEGLLVGLTVVLAIGMQRILKQKGLVRNLVSAETLGGVTTICLDKTGTLTEGKMKIFNVLGDLENLTTQSLVANDMDDSIVISAWEWAVERLGRGSSDAKINRLKEKHERIDSIPFSPKERFFASMNKWDEKSNMLFVSGAPEFLLEWTTLSTAEKAKIKEEIESLTSTGKRLLGFARKKMPLEKKTIGEKDAKSNLEWVGILSFADPVRNGVKEALDQATKAGIKTIVITGDYPQTAIYVMKELSIYREEDMVILGQDLEKLNKQELKGNLLSGNVRLFARTNPEQKLLIVEALRETGEVVAMMGDGVNDAPALKKADIGIVVSEATDVSKESADLVLMDSKFATVVKAVEEGRGIFDNVRKIIIYLMTTAFNEITAVTGAIVLGLPLPVTAAQILWINIVSDGFPNMALAIEPKRRGIMEEPPRSPKEPLVNNWMKVLIGIVSITSGILSLILFIHAYLYTKDEVLARSIGFVSLGINSLIYVFSTRTLKDPFWKEGFFENKWLLVAVAVGMILQIFPFLTRTSREFFEIVSIPFEYWIAICAVAIVMFIIVEFIKSFLRRGYFAKN
jgi:P-type Ca2+ transporter type 2C